MNPQMGVTAYLANQFGFSETGRYVLDTKIKPRLLDIGLKVYDPFVECGNGLDLERLARLEKHADVKDYWLEFSRSVTPKNNALMRTSDCLLAILDGGFSVDDGVASEIGFYAAIARGPIFALRSDFRCGENLAISINAQVLGYILMSGGSLADGPNATEKWFSSIQTWYDSLRTREPEHR
jgi:nucleoside 2-deoxyribosyltransferase